MIEFKKFVYEGQLSRYLSENSWMSLDYEDVSKSIVGVNFRYHPLFFDLARTLLPNEIDTNAIYSPTYSHKLASILYGATHFFEFEEPHKEESYAKKQINQLIEIWKNWCLSNYGYHLSPISIEVMHVSKHGPPVEKNYFPKESHYSLTWNKVEPGTLHRRRRRRRRRRKKSRSFIVSTNVFRKNSVGTLGGVMSSVEQGAMLYGVTAGHIFDRRVQRSIGVKLSANASFRNLFSSKHSDFSIFTDERYIDYADKLPSYGGRAKTSGTDMALLPIFGSPMTTLSETPSVGERFLTQGQMCTFNGARSGLVKAKIDSWSYWYRFLDPHSGNNTHIRDCILIKPFARPYFRKDLSRPGDSGAWLNTNSDGTEYWVGMLVGGDGDRSVVVPSKSLMDVASTKIGGPITPFQVL